MKRFFIRIAAIAAAALLTGCGAADKASRGEAAVTFTDMAGREITLYAHAERVVALNAADVEIIYAIGAGDCLAGRGEYCDWPAEAAALPCVQSGNELNIESVLALDADALVTDSFTLSSEQIATLEGAGVPVIVSDAWDIEGVYEAIGIIGAITGHESGAQALSASMQESFASVAGSESAAGKTVYFEVSPLEFGLWAAGSGTFMDEIASMIGLENCFGDVEGWAQISEEQVILRDPDYIVTVAMYFGSGLAPEEEIRSRRGWEGMKAVKNGGIINIRNNELSRPGPRLADGAKLLCDFIGGEE